MLQFLKNIDPIRFIVIAILAFLARFYWLSDEIVIIPTLQWLSIGEIMADHRVLYKDIWTSLEPFSAGTYYVIELVFGKSILALRILSLLLCILQAFLFNYYVSNTNIYDQKTAYPAFFYVLFSSLNYDFFSLSPVQLGLTFMLPVMYFLFKDVRMGEKSKNHFFAGACLGIASLFYLPFAFFIVFIIYSFAVFSSFDVKRFFQLISAFVFPWMMVFSYYYLNGSLNEVLSNLIQSTIYGRPQNYVDLYSIIQVALPATILSVIAFFFTVSKSTFLNYQYSSMKIMVMWFVNGLVAYFIMNERVCYNIYILIPVFTFFTVFLFLEIDRLWLKESLLWLVIFTFVGLHIYHKNLDTEKLEAHSSKILIYRDAEVRFNGDVIQNKNVLLLGPNPAALIHNKQSTIYTSWNLSLRHFGDLTNYNNISFIYSNVMDNKPEYILDQIGIMPSLIERIPELADYYEPSYDKKTYRLRK